MESLFFIFRTESAMVQKLHLSNQQTRVTFTLVPSTLSCWTNSRKRADSE